MGRERPVASGWEADIATGRSDRACSVWAKQSALVGDTPMRRLALIAVASLIGLALPALANCAKPNQPPMSGPASVRSNVQQIVDQIANLPPGRASRDEQQALFDRLIAIGPEAAPTIVALMDDRRPLPMPAISLENHAPDAFEGIRHYTPKQLVDALAAVLNQITGEHFGFIYNGATEAERTASVAAWREHFRMFASTSR